MTRRRRNAIPALLTFLPRSTDLRRKSFKEKFLGTFRCQTYWLLATRASWRVLWNLWVDGKYDVAKTDRITARAPSYAKTLVPLAGGSGSSDSRERR